MSIRSDPHTNPQKPDPVSRNQPTMPGNYPDDDSTSSGGYGASPDQVWSNRSQRGTDMPLSSSTTDKASLNSSTNSASGTGLIDQTTDGTNLKNELQDAKQGRDEGGEGTGVGEQNVWGVEKGAGKDF